MSCPRPPAPEGPDGIPSPQTPRITGGLTVGDARTAGILILALSAGRPASSGGVRGADAEQSVSPAGRWEKRTPEQVGLSAEKLKSLAGLAGGRGCVVRHGYLVYTWGDPAK